MYCRNCGNKINEDAKFCGICGTAVVMDNNVIAQNHAQSATQPNVGQPIPQQSFQQGNVYTPQTPTKSSKAPLIIAIIAIVVFFFLCFSAIGLAVYIAIASENIEETIDNNYLGKNTLVQHDVSLEYDNSWTKHPEEDGIISLTKSNETIGLAFDTSKYYYTTASLTTSVKEAFIDEGNIILEDIKEITINNQKWQKFICEKGNIKTLVLVIANNYDQYAFTYSAKDTIFDYEMYNIEKIYKTLKLDNTKQIESEKKAKEKLIGEWDWGVSGYFVIDDDKVYLFKDSSKSMENVFYGTYTADDKVATYATGYTEGMHIIMTIEKYYYDGEEVEINNNSNKLEFVFVPNKDGTYMIKNMVSYQSNTATKVK